MDIKRILFATDFSEASEPALHVAGPLARDNGAKLILLHASQTEDYPVGELFNEDPQPPHDEVGMLEMMASRVDNVDCECRWVHCDGSHEADVIVQTAAKENADMIVVGTHGHRGLSHLLAGSVAEKNHPRSAVPRLVRTPDETIHREGVEEPGAAMTNERIVSTRGDTVNVGRRGRPATTGQRQIKSLLRFLGIVTDSWEHDKYEPIYGLPTRSLDEWLSRNPALKREYEAELLARSSRGRCTRDKRVNGD